jgi:hypothetical protein
VGATGRAQPSNRSLVGPSNRSFAVDDTGGPAQCGRARDRPFLFDWLPVARRAIKISLLLMCRAFEETGYPPAGLKAAMEEGRRTCAPESKVKPPERLERAQPARPASFLFVSSDVFFSYVEDECDAIKWKKKKRPSLYSPASEPVLKSKM